MNWNVKKIGKLPAMKAPVLVEGLPGIGNVEKIAVDFLIEETKAKKIVEFTSYTLPHTVFVTEDNLVELPAIYIYHKKIKAKDKKELDLLFLAGDLQPTTEVSSYKFSEAVLGLMSELKCSQIITLGGIGLAQEPEQPKIFCTGTDTETVKKFISGTSASSKIYGVVGPIIGAAGLLVGMAKEKKIDAICLLAETFGHPLYIGVKGSTELLKILKKKLNIEIDVEGLSKEVQKMEKEIIKKTEQLEGLMRKRKETEANYIG